MKNDTLMRVCCLFVFVTFALISHPHKKKQNYGNISFIDNMTRVLDSDTIEIRNIKTNKIHRIKMFGIYTPESKQKFSKESKIKIISFANKNHRIAVVKSKERYNKIMILVCSGAGEKNRKKIN